MLPLREYLATRRADIQAQIKTLRIELAEIEAAERGVATVNGVAPARKERGSVNSGKKTLKEMAIEVLRHHPNGADAQTILQQIKERFGLDVARESLSPQLSRLSQDDVLAREGYIWRLANAIPQEWVALSLKDETPDAATSDASSLEEEADNDFQF